MLPRSYALVTVYALPDHSEKFALVNHPIVS